jgi:hypothetical protein
VHDRGDVAASGPGHPAAEAGAGAVEGSVETGPAGANGASPGAAWVSPGQADATGSEAAPARSPGWREVLLVAAATVLFVLALEALTSALPAAAQDLVFRTPLAIAILLVGTVGLLVWVVRRPAGS